MIQTISSENKSTLLCNFSSAILFYHQTDYTNLITYANYATDNDFNLKFNKTLLYYRENF